MSIYTRTYIARIAPCATTWREAMRHGASVVDNRKRWTESFAPNAFIATDKPAPVILSHHDGKPVGQVSGCWTDNGWHVASFDLDHSRSLSAVALDRLDVGVPVSIGFRGLRHDTKLAGDGVMWHTLARLDELSILYPDERPAYPGAKVVHMYERRKQPATSKQTDGEIIHHAGEVLRRPIGQVLRVR